MLLKPDIPKIKTVLSFIDLKAREFEGLVLTDSKIFLIMYYADIAHLNKHGRPVTFDTYRANSFGVEAFFASKLLGTDYDYDWDHLSESDCTELLQSIEACNKAPQSTEVLSYGIQGEVAARKAKRRGGDFPIIRVKDMIDPTKDWDWDWDEALWNLYATNASMVTNNNNNNTGELRDVQ